MGKTIINPSIAAGSQFKNRIINGDMRIDQRNAGNSATYAGNASGYHIDRWAWQISNAAGEGQFSIQRLSGSTPQPLFTYYQRVTVTTADTSIASNQLYRLIGSIEGYNMADFLWGSASAKTITMSFWVRSSLAGTYSVTIYNDANTRNYPATYTINSANTWEFKSITVPGETTVVWQKGNAGAAYITIGLAAGSSFLGPSGAWTTSDCRGGATGQVNWMNTLANTFDITGVQFEEGTVATPFEYRDIQRELALCQRYFCKTYDMEVAVGAITTGGAVEYRAYVAGTAGANGEWFNFPVSMRVNPIMAYYNINAVGTTWRNQTDDVNSGASGTQGGGNRGTFITNAQVATDAVGERLNIQATASAEL